MTTTPDRLNISIDRRPEVRIRMGRKPDKGFGVVAKDRFHLMNFQAEGSGTKAKSTPHPGFAAFNVDLGQRGLSGDALTHANRHFRTLYGVLIHSQWEQPSRLEPGCAYSRFSAHRLPGVGGGPGGRPACHGDGREAQRWNGDAYQTIPCPSDACEFRQYKRDQRGNDYTDCKRISTLVFQLRWPPGPCPECKGRMPAVTSCAVCEGTGKVDRDLPNATAMIESGGAYSYATSQWWGFYTAIVEQFRAIGGKGEPNLYGLPVRLSLTLRTVPARQARVWVPELHTDFPPGMSLQGWLKMRHETREALGDELAGVKLLGGPVRNTMGADEAADAVYDVLDAEAYEMPRGGK